MIVSFGIPLAERSSRLCYVFRCIPCRRWSFRRCLCWGGVMVASPLSLRLQNTHHTSTRWWSGEPMPTWLMKMRRFIRVGFTNQRCHDNGTFALPFSGLNFNVYWQVSPVSSASSSQLWVGKVMRSQKSPAIQPVCVLTLSTQLWDLQKRHLSDSGEGSRKSTFTFPTTDSELQGGRAWWKVFFRTSFKIMGA